MSNATTDHLAKARDYIAKGDDYYGKAAEEVMAARADGWTIPSIARELGRSVSWVDRLIAAAKTHVARDADEPFSVDHRSGSNKRDEVASKVLADPVQRRQVIASLPPAQVEAIIEDAHDVAIERSRAHYAEHDTTPKPPTVRDLMGGDRFDPSESWADTDIIRVQSKAHALARQVAKWGLVLGSLSEDEAFQMLQEAEQNVAEVRVTLQERIADRSRMEA